VENKNIQKVSYWAQIPAPVRYSKDITNLSKLLYAEISCLVNAKGYCFASNQYLCELFDVHHKTISKSIKELENAGFIFCEYQFKNNQVSQRKIYIVLDTRNQNGYEIVKSDPAGIDEFDDTPLRENADPFPSKSGDLSAKKRIPLREKVDTPPQKSGSECITFNVHSLMFTDNDNKHMFKTSLNDNAGQELFEEDFTAVGSNKVASQPKPTIFSFEQFWNMYDKKLGREICDKKYKKLNETERQKIKEHLPKYCLSTPDKQYRKNPITYLNQKCWNDDVLIQNLPKTAEKEKELYSSPF
jgi:hypothetical protein